MPAKWLRTSQRPSATTTCDHRHQPAPLLCSPPPAAARCCPPVAEFITMVDSVQTFGRKVRGGSRRRRSTQTMHGVQRWPPSARRSPFPSALSARLVSSLSVLAHSPRSASRLLRSFAAAAAAITMRSSSTAGYGYDCDCRLLALLRRSDRSAATAAAGRIPIALVTLAVHLLSHAAIALHLPR